MEKKRALGRLLAQEIPASRLPEVSGQSPSYRTTFQDWTTKGESSGYYDTGLPTPDQNNDSDGVVTD